MVAETEMQRMERLEAIVKLSGVGQLQALLGGMGEGDVQPLPSRTPGSRICSVTGDEGYQERIVLRPLARVGAERGRLDGTCARGFGVHGGGMVAGRGCAACLSSCYKVGP